MFKKIVIAFLVLVIIIIPLLAGGSYFMLLQSENRVEGKYFDSDGVKIHYTVEGEGIPVILVHGFAYNPDLNWRKPGIHGKLLEEGYQVITLDCRGHGLSDKPHGVENYGENMPADIARLMEHLDIEKVHLVGYSMGGFITLKFSDMYPEKLYSAMPGGMAWDTVKEEHLDIMNNIADALEKDGDFTPLLKRLNLPIEPGSIQARIARWIALRTNDNKALADVMRGFVGFQIKEERLKANTVPVLTIVGSIDPLVETADLMHETMGHHELVLVEGGDHITALADDVFIDSLLEFLQKHNPDSEALEAAEESLPEAA